MDIISIILIAVGLSMDSFAVSVSNGLTFKKLNAKKILLISLSLSIFQALMPLIGWYVGIGVEKQIREYVLLSAIGIKMIYDGLSKSEIIKNTELNFGKVILQSIATSIDAFVVGVSFAILNLSIIMPVLIIGLVTFVASIIGLQIGRYFSSKLGKSVEIFGGVVLIGINMILTFIIIIVTSIISYIAFSNIELFNKLKFNAYQIKHSNEKWRFVSYALVHSGWIHLIINMYVLYSFGSIVEETFNAYFGSLGSLYFLLLYVGGVLFATLFDFGKHKDDLYYNAVGASGAVAAVVFASILVYPSGTLFIFPIPFPLLIFGELFLALYLP